MKEASSMPDRPGPELPSPARISSRRHLLQAMLAGWGVILLAPALYILERYLVPAEEPDRQNERIDAGRFDLLPGPSEPPKLYRSKGKAIYICRNGQNQVQAISGICTHLGCLVEYNREHKNFRCNCHGSEFDLNGNNLSGPALRPLQPYRAEVIHDEVYLSPGAQL